LKINYKYGTYGQIKNIDEWEKIGWCTGVLYVKNQEIPLLLCELDFLKERTEGDYETVRRWAADNLIPYMTRKTINGRHTSYGLKHTAERELGMYVSNADIKLILAEFGIPFKARLFSPNTSYPLSQKFYSAVDRMEVRKGWRL